MKPEIEVLEQPHEYFNNALTAVIEFIEDEWESDHENRKYSINSALMLLYGAATKGGIAQDILGEHLSKVGLEMIGWLAAMGHSSS
jgi:hypothetical protein